MGKIINSDNEPGVHFKTPFINDVKHLSGKALTLNSKPERFLTSKKKNVIVDSYVKWGAVNAVRCSMRLYRVIKSKPL
ncbi:MAG: SPFH domain-containing protein [Methylococcaceae bacterium]